MVSCRCIRNVKQQIDMLISLRYLQDQAPLWHLRDFKRAFSFFLDWEIKKFCLPFECVTNIRLGDEIRYKVR
jgi:hypothetical protein